MGFMLIVSGGKFGFVGERILGVGVLCRLYEVFFMVDSMNEEEMICLFYNGILSELFSCSC